MDWKENVQIDDILQANQSNGKANFRHQDHQGRFKHNETYLAVTSTNKAPKPIDLLITYKQSSGKLRTLSSVVEDLGNRIYRQRFEDALVRQGIEISRTSDSSSGTNTLVVLKLHATDEFMLRQADSSDMKAPVQPLDTDLVDRSMTHVTCDKILKSTGSKNPFSMRNDPSNKYGDPHRNFISAPYSAKQKDMYISDKVSRLFTTIQRINLVWECVSQTKVKFVPEGAVEAKFMDKIYKKSAADHAHPDVSFQWFVNKNIYSAAFPLHDHNYQPSKSMINSLEPKQWPLRPWLYEYWVKTPFKVQPLNAIRAYFGEATAMYFSFIGFYTAWLFPAVVLGLITVCFGLVEAYAGTSSVTRTLCSSTVSNMTCRGCRSEFCHFASLEQQCPQKKFQITFDHYGATAYAFFISLWAVLFIEFWQRRQYELALRWEVSAAKQQSDMNSVRSEFLSSELIENKKSPATGQTEFFIPTKKLFLRRTGAALITLLFIGIQFGVMYGIIEYRELMLIKFNVMAYDGNAAVKVITPTVLVSVTSALLNAVSIFTMQLMWTKIIKGIVDMELQRTMASYETSYTYKMYLFQFVNYYGVLFYLALVKGKNVKPPNESGFTTEARCGPAGCLFEVCIQLAVLMSVKQLLSHFVELLFPWIRVKLLTLYGTIVSKLARCGNVDGDTKVPLWKRDWLLISSPTELMHYDDYLNTVIEFGFITIFTTAFPLAPLLALINNLFKIRIDGRKCLTLRRRPVPIPRGDIGPWNRVLHLVVEVAILINALVIAFTTTIIDYIVYIMHYAPKDVPYEAVINNVFDTQNYYGESVDLKYMRHEVYDGNMSYVTTDTLVPYCLYDARYAFDDKDGLINFRVNRYYILACRLAFVIMFCFMVMFVKIVIVVLVPDIPKDALERQERAEKFISDLQLKNIEQPAGFSGQDQVARRDREPGQRKGISDNVVKESVRKHKHDSKGMIKQKMKSGRRLDSTEEVHPTAEELDESVV